MTCRLRHVGPEDLGGVALSGVSVLRSGGGVTASPSGCAPSCLGGRAPAPLTLAPAPLNARTLRHVACPPFVPGGRPRPDSRDEPLPCGRLFRTVLMDSSASSLRSKLTTTPPTQVHRRGPGLAVWPITCPRGSGRSGGAHSSPPDEGRGNALSERERRPPRNVSARTPDFKPHRSQTHHRSDTADGGDLVVWPQFCNRSAFDFTFHLIFFNLPQTSSAQCSAVLPMAYVPPFG